MGKNSIGFLGGGQLGMMMGEAAQRMGFDCIFLDPSYEACGQRVGELVVIDKDFSNREVLKKFAKRVTHATFEWENVPATAVEFLAATGLTVHPSLTTLIVTSDRVWEKDVFRKLKIPTPVSRAIHSLNFLNKLACTSGLPLRLKTRNGGYDGRGQQRIADWPELKLAWQTLGAGSVPLIAEQEIAFDREISMIAARGADSETVFYPPMCNVHRDGILRHTTVLDPNDPITVQAQQYAEMLMAKLDYVGVMTVEFFQVGDVLYANEIAPRVHNSGHLTIEASTTSQFENHIRALVGEPLGPTDTLALAGMVNIIGKHPDSSGMLRHPSVHWHSYGKSARPKRKLGHVTVIDQDPDKFQSLMDELITLLK